MTGIGGKQKASVVFRSETLRRIANKRPALPRRVTVPSVAVPAVLVKVLSVPLKVSVSAPNVPEFEIEPALVIVVTSIVPEFVTVPVETSVPTDIEPALSMPPATVKVPAASAREPAATSTPPVVTVRLPCVSTKPPSETESLLISVVPSASPVIEEPEPTVVCASVTFEPLLTRPCSETSSRW